MSTNEPTRADDEQIRETYEEYVIRGESVAMIADPERTHAWIQSDVTVEIEQ
ncbi:hypothetical protein [Halomicrobium katesii]|uniref:hypothetical protein n=1 Tax=Halomicrobium katesii TaxID=437163 RepID=UPI00037A9FB8|nr:hypothetical protein [Halomicrobium katesii]